MAASKPPALLNLFFLQYRMYLFQDLEEIPFIDLFTVFSMIFLSKNKGSPGFSQAAQFNRFLLMEVRKYI